MDVFVDAIQSTETAAGDGGDSLSNFQSLTATDRVFIGEPVRRQLEWSHGVGRLEEHSAIVPAHELLQSSQLRRRVQAGSAGPCAPLWADSGRR